MLNPKSEQTSKRISHEELENGTIHRISYHEVSRKAVDDFIALFDSLITDAQNDTILCLIIDNEVNDTPQPLNYMLSELQRILRKHLERPAIRCAIVYERADAMFSFIDVIVRILARGKDKLRYFKRSQTDTMMAWLNEEDSKPISLI